MVLRDFRALRVRAGVLKLALDLLVLGIGLANDAHAPLPAHDLARAAHTFDAGSDLHDEPSCSVERCWTPAVERGEMFRKPESRRHVSASSRSRTEVDTLNCTWRRRPRVRRTGIGECSTFAEICTDQNCGKSDDLFVFCTRPTALRRVCDPPARRTVERRTARPFHSKYSDHAPNARSAQRRRRALIRHAAAIRSPVAPGVGIE